MSCQLFGHKISSKKYLSLFSQCICVKLYSHTVSGLRRCVQVAVHSNDRGSNPMCDGTFCKCRESNTMLMLGPNSKYFIAKMAEWSEAYASDHSPLPWVWVRIPIVTIQDSPSKFLTHLPKNIKYTISITNVNGHSYRPIRS